MNSPTPDPELKTQDSSTPPSAGSTARAASGSGPHASVRAQVAVETTPDTADSDLLHIRASDQTLDRYKEVIAASGWHLDNYLRNPVIQNAHQYGDIIFTIGRAEKTWVSGNALLQTWRFASNENPFAKIARDLYRGKFLQAASVGFIPIKWEDGPVSSGSAPASGATERAPRSESSYTRRYTEQELIEVSAVGIPANPNALTMALKQGAIDKSDLRELYALLSHLVGTARCAVRSDSVCSVPSVAEHPAFESLARQLNELASIFKHNQQQQPPQGAPPQTFGGGNRKENL